jgi:hypothetical protein
MKIIHSITECIGAAIKIGAAIQPRRLFPQETSETRAIAARFFQRAAICAKGNEGWKSTD